MSERTPAEAESDLARGRLAAEELPDIAAVWLSGSEWDSPALRELAGHPRNDLDGIRALWAQVRIELDVTPRSVPGPDQLTRPQFLEVMQDLADALGRTDSLDSETTNLLLQLWWALNHARGRQIEGLRPEEEALIVRAYAQYCDVTEPLLTQSQQRAASAGAVLALRALVKVAVTQA